MRVGGSNRTGSLHPHQVGETLRSPTSCPPASAPRLPVARVFFVFSLPEFMNFKLFGKTILVGNLKFELLLGHPLSQRDFVFFSQVLRDEIHALFGRLPAGTSLTVILAPGLQRVPGRVSSELGLPKRRFPFGVQA